MDIWGTQGIQLTSIRSINEEALWPPEPPGGPRVIFACVRPIQKEKEEIVKEVEPLGENPTPEEIAEFIKKIKDQNDN